MPKTLLLAIGLSFACSAILQADPSDPAYPNDPLYNPLTDPNFRPWEPSYHPPGVVSVSPDGTVERDGVIVGHVEEDPSGNQVFTPGNN